MKTCIIMCGLPLSGKTKTATIIKESLLEKIPDADVTLFTYSPMKPSWYTANFVNDRNSQILYETYRWAQLSSDNPMDVCILDVQLLNVFERQKFIDDISNAAEIAGNNINIIAVYHDRSAKYIREKNKIDEEKTIINDRKLSWYFRNHQQPIQEEGFDIVYRVTGQRDFVFEDWYNMMYDRFNWGSVDSVKEDTNEEDEV